MLKFTVENSTLSTAPWKYGDQYWASFELYPDWTSKRFYTFKVKLLHFYRDTDELLVGVFKQLSFWNTLLFFKPRVTLKTCSRGTICISCSYASVLTTVLSWPSCCLVWRRHMIVYHLFSSLFVVVYKCWPKQLSVVKIYVYKAWITPIMHAPSIYLVPNRIWVLQKEIT